MDKYRHTQRAYSLMIFIYMSIYLGMYSSSMSKCKADVADIINTRTTSSYFSSSKSANSHHTLPSEYFPLSKTTQKDDMLAETLRIANLMQSKNQDANISFSPLGIHQVLHTLSLASAIKADTLDIDDGLAVESNDFGIVLSSRFKSDLLSIFQENQLLYDSNKTIDKNFRTEYNQRISGRIIPMSFLQNSFESVFQTQSPNIQSKQSCTSIFDEQDKQTIKEASLIFINCFKFHSDWIHKFPVTKTTISPFQNSDGMSVNVSMMHNTGQYQMAHDSGWTQVTVPFADGASQLNLYLPDITTDTKLQTTKQTSEQQHKNADKTANTNGVNQVNEQPIVNEINPINSKHSPINNTKFTNNVTAVVNINNTPYVETVPSIKVIQKLHRKVHKQRISLDLPVVNITANQINLVDVYPNIQKWHLKHVFTDNAQFKLKALHRATIKWDEHGAEASSATMAIGSRSVNMPTTTQVSFDRPFFYTIESNQQVIFAGSIRTLPNQLSNTSLNIDN